MLEHKVPPKPASVSVQVRFFTIVSFTKFSYYKLTGRKVSRGEKHDDRE